MDRSFHAILTILHRVPREVADHHGKRGTVAPQRGKKDSILDLPEGWIRVAL